MIRGHMSYADKQGKIPGDPRMSLDERIETIKRALGYGTDNYLIEKLTYRDIRKDWHPTAWMNRKTKQHDMVG